MAGARVNAASRATASDSAIVGPVYLTLANVGEVEHAQADDHRAGTGDQGGTDLRDRFVEGIVPRLVDGAALRSNARSGTGSSRFPRRRARR